MNTAYNNERAVQMLIYLLKAHNIKKIVASPGTTNITFVGSLQSDPYFEIYSAPEERSAAYMACGLAAESGEAVVLTCTGATASRNYIPGLTEAFYRKLPVLAVTSTQHVGRIGQLVPQVIDRSIIQNDISVMNVTLPIIHSAEDEKDCNIKINTALLALFHRGGGPVHINLQTEYTRTFDVKNLPDFRVIREIGFADKLPAIKAGKVGIFIGAHKRLSQEMIEVIDGFCEKYNACVFIDHTSNYYGKYGVLYNLVSDQTEHKSETGTMDLLIDIGDMSGAYMSLRPKTVWRVCPDGKVADRFGKMTYLFDMDEYVFFRRYNAKAGESKENISYYKACISEYRQICKSIPELPFSNAWVARNSVDLIPKSSVLHLGILNSLRCWNFFEIDNSVEGYCNTGGFGIDGIVSTFIGSALVFPDRLHFCVLGDLAFFYDLNSMGNRHVGKNCRIMLINNGVGTEFKNYNHFAAQFGDDANAYMAAMGHYGVKSPYLVKHYAEDLGFTYLCANDKKSYLEQCEIFFSENDQEKPIIFEVFTDHKDESDALRLIKTTDDRKSTSEAVKDAAKDILGAKNIEKLRKIVKR